MSTVVELPANLRDPMRQRVNRGLMVQFINGDLFNRGNLDVRKSYVFYDADGLFVVALPYLPASERTAHSAPSGMEILYSHGIRYWSKGVK